jgi:Ca2+-binding RTX toxin-like protein
MSNPPEITLADGQAVAFGFSSARQDSRLTFQFLDADGQPTAAPVLIEDTWFADRDRPRSSSFDAAPLNDGGFVVAYDWRYNSDSGGIAKSLHVEVFDGAGALVKTFRAALDPAANFHPDSAPQLITFPGSHFAVLAQTFDGGGSASSHLFVETGRSLMNEVVLASHPTAVFALPRGIAVFYPDGTRQTLAADGAALRPVEAFATRAAGANPQDDSGPDSVMGTADDDTLMGGAGDDIISGRGGANYLRGGEGDDIILGGDGFDDAHGNMGDDVVYGGGGDDWVVGGKGDDLLYGDDGRDIVYGNLGQDTCVGGTGDDLIRGGQGNDVVIGGAGNDWLSGDRGDDTISGGLGADVFHSFGEAGLDLVLDFHAAEGDRVQLDPGTVYTVRQAGADTVIDMEGGATMVLAGVTAAALPPGWIFLG